MTELSDDTFFKVVAGYSRFGITDAIKNERKRRWKEKRAFAKKLGDEALKNLISQVKKVYSRANEMFNEGGLELSREGFNEMMIDRYGHLTQEFEVRKKINKAKRVLENWIDHVINGGLEFYELLPNRFNKIGFDIIGKTVQFLQENGPKDLIIEFNEEGDYIRVNVSQLFKGGNPFDELGVYRIGDDEKDRLAPVIFGTLKEKTFNVEKLIGAIKKVFEESGYKIEEETICNAIFGTQKILT